MWRHLPTPRNYNNNKATLKRKRTLPLTLHTLLLSPLIHSLCLSARPASNAALN